MSKVRLALITEFCPRFAPDAILFAMQAESGPPRPTLFARHLIERRAVNESGS
jgi:hypothetical protein